MWRILYPLWWLPGNIHELFFNLTGFVIVSFQENEEGRKLNITGLRIEKYESFKLRIT